MAANNKKPSKITIKGQLAKIRKEMGAEVAVIGPKWDNSERAPTGSIAIDYPLGGGFPRGRTTVIWGKESSGKTTMALMAIAYHQKVYPHHFCVFVDVEGHYDTAHGEMLGVDNSKLIYVLPDYAEQVVDIVEQFLYAEDCGILVLDSLAAMVTANELDSSASKAVVGGAGLVVNKLYRKASRALNVSRQKGCKPTFIAISQVRMKIGVMFGNPETMSGGTAFKYKASLVIYSSGKPGKDEKLHPELDVWRICTFKIEKTKVPILAQSGEYRMAIADSKLFKKGFIDDWKYVKARLEDLKLMVKAKSAWVCCGYEFQRQGDIRVQLRQDPNFYSEVVAAIMPDKYKALELESEYKEEPKPKPGPVTKKKTKAKAKPKPKATK